jgi:histidinol-phosphatase
MATTTNSTPPPADPVLLHELRDLLLEAGEITLRWFRGSDLGLEWKSDGTPVTAADKAGERFLREQIGRRHPADAILGEEEDEIAGTSGRRWVIDPIDGTKAFTRGVPLYTNLLAVEDEHGIAVGAINVPALGEIVYAGRGLGCFVMSGLGPGSGSLAGARVGSGMSAAHERPAHVSEESDPERAVLTTSGYDYWTEPMLVAARRSGFTMRTWGDGYGYVLVATGRVEVMVDPYANPWDLAPMPVILSEAGGRLTSLAGEPGWTHGNAVASNGHVHAAVLDALAPSDGGDSSGATRAGA